MRERLKHWSAASVLVLATGASLVACTGESNSQGDASGVGATSGTTLTEANFFEEIAASSAKAGTSHVTWDIKTGGRRVSAEGDVKFGDSARETAMAMKLESGQEMRLVDNVFYLNFGPITQNKFAKIDLGDESNPISRQYRDLIENVDPVKQVEQFQGAVTSFEKKGEPIELDGVQAQPYTIVVDPSKVERLKDSGAPLPKQLTNTMWVGPDNLPRRMVSKLPDTAGAGATSLTSTYTQWGQEIDITAPPASEISDQDMLRQMQGEQR